VFENRVLRRIFGPKRDKVTGELRKLYDELHDLYSPNVRWVGHVARMGEERDMYRILVGKETSGETQA
jgi:hypothetical protein